MGTTWRNHHTLNQRHQTQFYSTTISLCEGALTRGHNLRTVYVEPATLPPSLGTKLFEVRDQRKVPISLHIVVWILCSSRRTHFVRGGVQWAATQLSSVGPYWRRFPLHDEWNGMEWNGMVEARSYVRALRAATADILCHCCQCQPPQQQQQCIQRHRTQPGTSQRRTGSTVHWLSIYPISPHGVDVSQPIARTEAAADKAKT